MSVKSVISTGFQGTVIDVECHLSNGLPGLQIVGYASKSLDEAKERVRSAFSSSQLELPRKRIVLNLAPADIPKDGSSFDLAIALSILESSKQVRPEPIENVIVIGELGLEGDVRPVRGIIGKIRSSKDMGFKKFIIPSNLVFHSSPLYFFEGTATILSEPYKITFKASSGIFSIGVLTSDLWLLRITLIQMIRT